MDWPGRCRIVEAMRALVIDTATSTGLVALVHSPQPFPAGTKSPDETESPAGVESPASTGSPNGADIRGFGGFAWDALQVVSQREITGNAHNEQLTPALGQLCDEAGIAPTDIDVVIVGDGPGPFTGLRVGMATAAAFAQAIGCPVVGCCSHDALAVAIVMASATATPSTISDTESSDTESSYSLTVATDARRREVYWSTYYVADSTNGADDTFGADAAEAIYPGLVRVQGPTVSAPDAAEIHAVVAAEGRIAPQLTAADSSPLVYDARAFVAVVGTLIDRQGASALTQPPRPRYLRRPDAVAPKPLSPSTAIDFSAFTALQASSVESS